jgi:transcriptional regulator with XRE-family HTH domain
MNIGQKIRQIRKSKDLSQEYLAEKMDITAAYISKIENGSSDPDSEL